MVTGPMMKEKAPYFAKDLDVGDFKASNGWLQSFLWRHNISFGVMSGENGEVKPHVVDEWNGKLPDMCKDYDPKDIFNMDESGLFYRSTVSKSFHVKGETYSGGKLSKERLTVSFCSSMTGEKEPIVVIGKSANPRCFQKVPASSLPVHYYHNKKAWMTGSIFEDWLKKFDRKMTRQGCRVLMFLDNAPSHPKLSLKNVTLQFLPLNTTSKSQPMDQGIIQAVKLKYRRRQLQHIFANMTRHNLLSGSELLKQISVLDVIYWVNRAWDQVETDTIVKCFAAAEFLKPGPVALQPEQPDADDEDDDEDYEEDDVPLQVIRLSMDLFGVGFADAGRD
ncbi:tigger transposable element-derived protein 4-like [Argopecten irradians]|uniref:tigger transposable element-derived protein 4-like n=1 Tax=Argopecten irradians TaxID=31199 RepID=UPI00371B7312